MNGESDVFRLGRNIVLFPVVHGSGDSAVEVRRLMLNQRFDCLAVPLPPSFQGDVEQAVEGLPRISVVLQRQPQTDFTDSDSDEPSQTASYVPIDPCQPVISAIRIAMQERISRAFIDIESDDYLPRSAVLPDPWALKRVSPERFAAAVLPSLRRPEAESDWAQLRWMAGRLQQLSQQLPGEPEVWLQRVRLARLAGIPQQVSELLQSARQHQSVSDLLLREVAGVQLQIGQQALAEQLLTESGTAPPHRSVRDPWLEQLRSFDASGVVASAQADLQRQQGQLDKAVQTLSTLANRFPERSRPALNRALALRDQGNAAAALAELVELATRFPEDPLILFHLAVTAAQAGQPAQALQTLERCLQLKPDYGLARAVRADLLEAAGQVAAAIQEYRQAVADSPGDPWIRFGLVHLLLRQKQLPEAAETLQPIQSILTSQMQAETAELQRLQNELQQATVTEPLRSNTQTP